MGALVEAPGLARNRGPDSRWHSDGVFSMFVQARQMRNATRKIPAASSPRQGTAVLRYAFMSVATLREISDEDDQLAEPEERKKQKGSGSC